MREHACAVTIALLALALPVAAHAQPASVASVVAACGTPAITYAAGDTKPLTMDTHGNLCQGGAGGGTVPGGVTLVPPTGTPNETSVTCGVTSTTLLAAAAATQFVLIKVPNGGGVVWVNVAGVAAVTAPPSFDLGSGASQLWSPGSGFVPSSQISCIAPVAQAVTVVSK